MLSNTTEYTPLDSLERSMIYSCLFMNPVNTSLPWEQGINSELITSLTHYNCK